MVVPSRLVIGCLKDDEGGHEAEMSLKRGQWRSLDVMDAGLGLVVDAIRRARVQLTFPNRFADEASSVKKKK